MTSLIIAAFIAGALTGIWATIVTTVIWTQHQALKAAREALAVPQPTVRAVQERINAHYDPTVKVDTPRFSGIGPTDIASREMYEREQHRKTTTPPFASPAVLNPSMAEIELAAQEATEGGKPN